MRGLQKQHLKKFYEEVGEKYPEQEIVYQTLKGKLRKKFVLSHLHRFKGRLLDVGCNQGMYLQHYKGGSSFGVDLSHSVLQKVPQNSQTHLIVGDAERLFAFQENSFDAVLCSEVIEHCLNPQSVFNGIAHVLQSGGTALITTPNYSKFQTGWIDLGELRHYDVHSDCNDTYFHTAFRPEELCELARGANLKVETVGTFEKEIKYASKIPVVILLAGRLLNRIFRSSRFDHFNQKFFERLSIMIYNICRFTGLDRILVGFIKEGVRSYILLRKP